jgi:DNA-binding phage protein
MTTHKQTHEELIKKLHNVKEAEVYFLAVIEECKKLDKETAQKHLMVALKNLVEAQGGLAGSFANISEKVGLGSESFYKVFSTVILKVVK